MSSKRAYIPLTEQLAAALIQIGEIPHEHAKKMTPAQIRSLFHLDHWPIAKVDGGPDKAWNLTWRLIKAHRRKTATIDQRDQTKARHLMPEQEAFRQRMLSKTGQASPPPRPTSRLQGRGFDKRYKKTFRGAVLR